jgi:hypothetical protein
VQDQPSADFARGGLATKRGGRRWPRIFAPLGSAPFCRDALKTLNLKSSSSTVVVPCFTEFNCATAMQKPMPFSPPTQYRITLAGVVNEDIFYELKTAFLNRSSQLAHPFDTFQKNLNGNLKLEKQF